VKKIHSQNSVKIFGLVKRGLGKLYIKLGEGEEVQLEYLHDFPFRFGDTFGRHDEASKWVAFGFHFKFLLRNPRLFLPFVFRVVTAELEIPNLTDDYLSITVKNNDGKLTTLIARKFLRIGIKASFLDIRNELEFQRNLYSYDLLLTKFKLNKSWQNRAPETSAVTGTLRRGPFNELGELISGTNSIEPVYLSNWSVTSIKDPEIFHGKVIVRPGEFFEYDSNHIPKYGDAANLIPGILSQNESGRFDTTGAKEILPPLSTSVFFIGAINNWMHFLIEELPRIYFMEILDPNALIPLVIPKGLSKQILQTIGALTPRLLIECGDYESVRVQELTLFHFNNPLPKVMNGVLGLDEQLFDPSILDWFRKRVEIFYEPTRNVDVSHLLIRREVGLFRNLVNMNKISSTLLNLGFTRETFLANLELREIQTLFESKRVIIAEYGAGLGNIVFAMQAEKVIEIRSIRDHECREYEILANTLGIAHKLILGCPTLLSRLHLRTTDFRLSRSTLSYLFNVSR